MKIDIRGPMQSRPVQENKPLVAKVEPPPTRKVEPNPVQKRLNQDLFTTDTRTRQAQSLVGSTSFQAFQLPTTGTPGGPVAPSGGGPVTQTAQATPLPPGQGAAVSPEVQAALDELNKFQPESQAYGLALSLQDHPGDGDEDVAFRRELLTALGPDRVAQLLTQMRDKLGEGPGVAEVILEAAIESYPLADQGKLVQAMGPEVLGSVLREGVEAAGSPVSPDREAALARMQGLATLMGDLHSLPPGSPGQSEAAGALDHIQNSALEGDTPGASIAAWIVANSGSDSLRSDFANGYLEALKADPASLAPEEARAVAWALGSMTQSPTSGLGAIVDLPEAQRTQFLGQLSASDGPELQTGAFFQEDALAGVNEFLMDVSRLDPGSFPNAQAAKELRIETFQQISKAVEGDFLRDSPGTHGALASMFAADTEGIVNTSANTSHRLNDPEGQALAKFFDHVAFRGEDSRSLVTEALQKYLGVGAEKGIVDALSEHKGDEAFMASQGNVLARNMGFVLGALYQGSQGALQNIDDEHARKKAIVDVMGSLVESTLEASPVAGMYSKIKSGTGDRASVEAVFDWLGDHFVGDKDAGKDAVTKLSGAVIEGAWGPFFGDEALKGARPQDLIAMFAIINAGVARADGRTGDPNINIGGAYIQ
ncbi:hypothetical protein [Corallococcus sp. CA053C]|uniref:hypothetical protein n=1 Tax=Corallococcus sp. CA053C TaxID=2316732 RepID=UPI0011C43A34|nr:hypothetical protein [Corallococcus sp. CA053C]